MKIVVMGYSGAGKSTLAKRLAARYGVPVLYLDTVHWLPGWKERPDAEGREIVERFLDENTGGWAIDGNYRAYARERRLNEADRILLLLLPRLVCARAAYRRYRENRGRSRENLTEGCDEKFDFEFLRWILFGARSRKNIEDYREIAERFPEKTRVFRTRKEIDDYVTEAESQRSGN